MTLGAVSLLTVVEGEDVLLVDRPPLPNGDTLIQSFMAGGNDYTVQLFDLSSSTPTTDLFTSAETGASGAAGQSNFPQDTPTELVVYAAIAAPTATYGGLWDQDATGYSTLFLIKQSELDTAMEGGHIYCAEMKFTTDIYGDIYSRWIIHVSPLIGS